MLSNSIFHHTSFITLDKTQEERVRDYAKKTILSQLPQFDTHEIFKSQTKLSVSLDYWGQKIDMLTQFINDSADFQYMTDDQKSALDNELIFAIYIFSARYHLDYAEGRGYSEEGEQRDKQLQKCVDLINALRKELKRDELVVPLIVIAKPAWDDNGIQTGLNGMCSFNERRLYWVWAGRGGLLGTVIDLLPDNFYNKIQALDALNSLVPSTTFLSWGLYYFRFAIRAGIVLWHTIPGKWMSTEERSIPLPERLGKQLQINKFYLMNDFFWASGNLACTVLSAYYGGVLTAFLLLMDVYLTQLAYQEEETQYLSNRGQYKTSAIDRIGRQSKLDQDYKLYAMYVDTIYAICLLLAFSLIYCFFLPVLVPLMFSVTGTALCFSLNALSAVIKKGIDVCKSMELLHYVEEDCKNENQSVFDLKLLKSEWIYHQKIIEYKQADMIRSVLIDIIVPPVVFIALVFMPVSIGLSVISAAFALAVASYYYVDENYQHDMKCLPACSPDSVNLAEQLTSLGSGGLFRVATHYLHKIREQSSPSKIFCETNFIQQP